MLSAFYHRLRQKPLSFPEFVAMMACSMAIYAAAVDLMLPALPAMGRSFSVTNDSQLQWVVMLFVLGGGSGQVVYGPLADWLGRRAVLLSGIALYVVCSLAASQSQSVEMLLVMRLAQGLAAAACAVIPRSIVRDRYAGPQMAKVMSLTFIVFLIVPVAAPSVGQALLLVLPWRGLFLFLGIGGVLLIGWIFCRLPETMHEEYRRAPSLTHLVGAARAVVGEPSSINYTIAIALIYGGLMAYISTVPQIFVSYFQRESLMPTVFGICAGTMALAAFTNVRIVEKIGMRRVSHTALCCFVLVSATHTLVCLMGFETMVSFTILQALTMGSFGLASSNFNAIAMQKMGAIAGSAASFQGIVTTIGGSLIGSLIGHQWSGSVIFLPAGTLVCGLLALASVLVAEKGRLFRNI